MKPQDLSSNFIWHFTLFHTFHFSRRNKAFHIISHGISNYFTFHLFYMTFHIISLFLRIEATRPFLLFLFLFTLFYGPYFKWHFSLFHMKFHLFLFYMTFHLVSHYCVGRHWSHKTFHIIWRLEISLFLCVWRCVAWLTLPKLSPRLGTYTSTMKMVPKKASITATRPSF